MKSVFKIILTIFIPLFFATPFVVEAAVLSRPSNNLGLVGYWKLGVDGRQGASELNTNWDIEDGVTTNWAFDAKTDGIRANETTDVFRGSTSAKLTNSTISSIAFWQDGMSTADGELYLVSVWAKDIDSPTTPYFSVNLGALREAGTTSGGSFAGIATDRWKHFWSVWESTSTTIDPYIRTGSNAVQGSFLVDDFSVQKLQATDFSGNGNHGDLINSVELATGHRGDSNGAFYFSGSGEGEYITISNASVLGTTDTFSISAWVKTTSVGDAIYCECSSNGDNTRNFLSISSGGNASLDQYSPSGGNLASNAVINDNEWHHVLYVQSGTNRKFYIDGVLDIEDNAAETFVGTTPTATRIAYRGSNQTGYNYTGYIDELRVYNRALSASEAFALYNLGKISVGAKKALSDIGGLVGWWTMDGGDISGSTVTDASGSGNDGLMGGDPIPVLGRIGQALEFDGNDQLSISHNFQSDIVNNFSVGAWVNSDVSGGQYGIVSTNGHTNGWTLYMREGPQFSFIGFIGGGSTGIKTTPSGEIGINTWHHVMYTYDNQSIKGYVDGVLKHNSALSGDFQVNNSNISIGNGTNLGSPKFWDGFIDDVRIYNKVLTESEVKRIYNATRPSSVNVSKTNRISDGLVAHWTFDGPNIDLSATTAEVRDISGGAHHGDAKNGAGPTIGKIGQGFVFDGSDDYIQVPNSTDWDFGTGDLAISFWFKTSATGRMHALDFGGNNGTNLSFDFNDSIYGIWIYWMSGGSPRVRTTTFYNDGEWHHLVFRRSGTSAEFFVDNISKGTLTDSTNINITGDTFIGAGSAGGLRWNGGVDDIRVYNRSLSDAEVEQLYNMGK